MNLFLVQVLRGKYLLNGNTNLNVTIDLIEGSSYKFDLSDSSNANHPLRFSTTSNGILGGGEQYTNGVTISGTPGTSGAFVNIVVETKAPTLYYFCNNHSGMGGQINTNDINSIYSYYSSTTNNALQNWNIIFVDNLVMAGDIASQWFGTAAPATQQIQDISNTKLMDVVATTWADKVQINRVAKATDSGGRIEAKQIDFAAGEVAGSVISGGNGNDDIKGYAGWDFLDGGSGDDLIHGGNGRDIISGGAGRDELHGDFGWNTYRSEIDGVSDLIAIKSDHYLVNWLYGKAGNSPNGEKSDIIEGLDAIDKIRIIGVDTSEITFAANVITKGVTGIGIYGKGILEALYTGGDLTLAQITQMTSGDASAAAMSNSINAYRVW
jgi:Ca2+-binding RTX toxin-like protein